MKQHNETEKKSTDSSSNERVKPPEVKGNSSGVDPVVPITDTTNPKRSRLIMQMLEKDNLNIAFKNVVINKGSAGVDGMTVKDLKPYIQTHWSRIMSDLEKGIYRPRPIKKVEIPKPDGGVRMLGIPCVIDRFIQQALHQILSPIWEEVFSDNSYGFRPGRSAAAGVLKSQSYQNEGYTIVVDMDLSKFFDEVNHKRLMSRIMEKTPGQWEIHRLIHRYLETGMMIGGVVNQRVKGVPQGSPLSPLLSNIVLDELDKEIESRGLKHVRYADDCNIYVKSKRSGDRVFDSITTYLEKKMKLKVNKDKSKVDRPVNRKFLGFSFYYKKGGVGIRVAPKSISRLKDKVRELCKYGKGMNLEIFIHEKLNPCLRGWFNYYRIADMQTLCQELDQWIRHRLRNIMWRQWKRNWTRFVHMCKAGLSKFEASKAAFSNRGPWHNACGLSMNTAFPIFYFDNLGLFNLKTQYMHLKKLVNGTAVYGSVRTVV